MPEPMLDQYFDLMGACAQGGARAFGDAALLLQLYLILLSSMLAALVVAGGALLGVTATEQSEVAVRARLWERISAACMVDRVRRATRQDWKGYGE